MGFPYGDGLYGRGLYSRRPDWWRDRTCQNDAWGGIRCEAVAWETPAAAPVQPWQPLRGARPARQGGFKPFGGA
jgi:hypothetical protein